MTRLQLVLYAEGPNEAGVDALLPAPGGELPPTAWGPAHHLVERLAAAVAGDRPRSVAFLSPLRLPTGRPHRGSDLLVGKRLRQLLEFATHQRAPDLAIVLVDEDGVPGRRQELVANAEGVHQPHVIAVAVREFESWLIADQKALSNHLGVKDTPPSPESMPRGRAKELLRNWIAERDAASARAHLAQHSDLGALRRLAAFQQFEDDLRSAIRTVG